MTYCMLPSHAVLERGPSWRRAPETSSSLPSREFSLLQKWALGMKEYKTRAGVPVVMDPREHKCSSPRHGLVCKGGDRYKMDRGVAVVLGSYRGHIWYRLEDDREEEQDHAGNAWYWTKEELAQLLDSGDVKVAKEKSKKKKKHENRESNEAGSESDSESEDDDDDPLVEEGAQTLAMYIGDQGFSERECRDLVLMHGKSCDAAVAFVFSGVDAKSAAIEWRAAKNAEIKEKKEAKQKKRREKELAKLAGDRGGSVQGKISWRSQLKMDNGSDANADASTSIDITFEQFTRWMDDPRWQKGGASMSSSLSLSSMSLDQALVTCVNKASDASSKEPKHLSAHDLANALADLPKLQEILSDMSVEESGSGGKLKQTGNDVADKLEESRVEMQRVFLARFATLLNLNKKMAHLLPLIDLCYSAIAQFA